MLTRVFLCQTVRLHATLAFWSMKNGPRSRSGQSKRRAAERGSHGMLQMHATLAFWTRGMHHAPFLESRGHDVIGFDIQSDVEEAGTASAPRIWGRPNISSLSSSTSQLPSFQPLQARPSLSGRIHVRTHVTPVVSRAVADISPNKAELRGGSYVFSIELPLRGFPVVSSLA